MAVPAFLSTAGSFIGSNLGDIGSALGGVASIGSMFGLGSSGGTSLFKSKALMDHQNAINKDYTQWLNENQYSQLRSGLEKAGYNPLLALGASPQQGTSSIATAQSSEKQDMSAMLNAMAMISQIRKTNAETQKLETNTVEKILDNVDSLTDRLGVPRALPLIKGLIDDFSQNSASSSNSPTLYGRASKFVKAPLSQKIDMLGRFGSRIGSELGQKAVDYYRYGSSNPNASDFNKLSIPNKFKYLLMNLGIY